MIFKYLYLDLLKIKVFNKSKFVILLTVINMNNQINSALSVSLHLNDYVL